MAGLGWNPRRAVVAEAEVMTSGRYCTVAAPTAPLPKAICLTRYRINTYNQGQVGTCWVHSAKQMAEISARSLGYEAYPISRHLIGYYAKETYEGGGNAADGGSPTDAIRAISDKGIGIAHEDRDPYVPDRRSLGIKPPPEVYEDAKDTHLLAPVVVKSIDQAKQLIASGRPVCNGIPWPGNWEGPGPFVGPAGAIARNPDGSQAGHSICLVGFVNAGVLDEFEYLIGENWRDPRQYRALSGSQAALIPGYEPALQGHDTTFLVKRSDYVALCQGQVVEHVSGTDYAGLAAGIVDASPSFADGSWF